jgi:glutamate N-acetyltransferase/amino-acid N-acetyltransferase
MLAPKGYSFAAAAAGFKRQGRLDLAALVSDRPAAAAGVFTKNRFTAAPVEVCREHLARSRTARAVLVNSGQANACTGPEGLAACRRTLKIAAAVLDVPAEDILPASTGVIGAQLKLDLWAKAAPLLGQSLGRADAEDAARAIMTTDTFPKLASATARLSGGETRLLGLAKGAGMICPNMATLLCFVLCDAEVDAPWWRRALKRAAEESFNRITVDGDTSTNDTLLALANGACGAKASSPADKKALFEALVSVCQTLAEKIVEDAEGGTKVARIQVSGARSRRDAELVARAVGHSPLVKTALYGRDANWGRIVAAAGRSGASFDPQALVLEIGDVVVFRAGQPAEGDLDARLAPVMERRDIDIRIRLGSGRGEYLLLASDLSRKYVEINADYRT